MLWANKHGVRSLVVALFCSLTLLGTVPGHGQATQPPGEPTAAAENVPRLLSDAFKLFEQGRYSDAEWLLLRAQKDLSDAKVQDSMLHGSVATALGIVYAQTHRYQEAIPLLRQALEIAEKHGQTTNALAAKQNLAGVLGEAGFAPEAAKLLSEVLDEIPDENLGLRANVARNLARMYATMGQFDKAQRLTEKVLQLAQQWKQKDKTSVSAVFYTDALFAHGFVLHAQGRLKQARTYLENALREKKRLLGTPHPSVANNLVQLAHLAEHQGRRRDAQKLLAEAVRMYGTLLQRELAVASVAQHDKLRQTWHRRLDQLLSLGPFDPPLLELVFEAVLDWKGPAARSLAARQAQLAQHAHKEARALLERRRTLQSELVGLILGRSNRSIDQLVRRRNELLRELRTVELQLGEMLPAWESLRAVSEASIAELTMRLPGNGALVEFVRYRPFQFVRNVAAWEPARYTAFVLRPAGEAGFRLRQVDLGPAKPIDEAIARWRAAVGQGNSPVEPNQVLMRRVWQPILQCLEPGVTQLLLSPDGALCMLPLGALRQDNGTYLAERYRFRYVAGGRTLLLAQHEPNTRTATIIAAPDYGAVPKLAAPQHVLRRSIARFQPLPGVKAEVAQVAELLNRRGYRVVRLEGKEATESKLFRLDAPSILYIATHGFFATARRSSDGRGIKLVPNAPTPSQTRMLGDDELVGLALAGANQWIRRHLEDESNDGLLTVPEAETLLLRGTELVVLSACSSAAGASEPGEGMRSLCRAFRIAGAKNVVAALWDVPDRETAQLMVQFLARWITNHDAAAALQEAQQTMIRRLRARRPLQHAPPLYWAGFIVYGP